MNRMTQDSDHNSVKNLRLKTQENLEKLRSMQETFRRQHILTSDDGNIDIYISNYKKLEYPAYIDKESQQSKIRHSEKNLNSNSVQHRDLPDVESLIDKYSNEASSYLSDRDTIDSFRGSKPEQNFRKNSSKGYDNSCYVTKPYSSYTASVINHSNESLPYQSKTSDFRLTNGELKSSRKLNDKYALKNDAYMSGRLKETNNDKDLTYKHDLSHRRSDQLDDVTSFLATDEQFSSGTNALDTFQGRKPNSSLYDDDLYQRYIDMNNKIQGDDSSSVDTLAKLYVTATNPYTLSDDVRSELFSTTVSDKYFKRDLQGSYDNLDDSSKDLSLENVPHMRSKSSLQDDVLVKSYQPLPDKLSKATFNRASEHVPRSQYNLSVQDDVLVKSYQPDKISKSNSIRSMSSSGQQRENTGNNSSRAESTDRNLKTRRISLKQGANRSTKSSNAAVPKSILRRRDLFENDGQWKGSSDSDYRKSSVSNSDMSDSASGTSQHKSVNFLDSSGALAGRRNISQGLSKSRSLEKLSGNAESVKGSQGSKSSVTVSKRAGKGSNFQHHGGSKTQLVQRDNNDRRIMNRLGMDNFQQQDVILNSKARQLENEKLESDTLSNASKTRHKPNSYALVDSRLNDTSTLLGYDWIAGMLDNTGRVGGGGRGLGDGKEVGEDEGVLEGLREFRLTNRGDCIGSTSIPNDDVTKGASDIPDPFHTCIHGYVVDDRLFTRPVNTDSNGHSICPVCSQKRSEPTSENPGFVRVSIPRSAIEKPYEIKPRRRRSFDAIDSCALAQHCQAGYEVSRLSTQRPSSTLDLKSALNGVKYHTIATEDEAKRFADLSVRSTGSTSTHHRPYISAAASAKQTVRQ